LGVGSSAIADEREPGLIGGVDLGVSIPTSRHYSNRTKIGGAALPYVGYMLSDYIGLQFNGIFAFQTPQDAKQNVQAALGQRVPSSQWTSTVGYVLGPRLEFPFEQYGAPLHLYGVAQGGGFTGLSGVLTQTEPGMSFGGGLEYYLDENLALSVFGRWNRILGGGRPNCIGNPSVAGCTTGPPTVFASEPNEGPVDFAIAGIGVKYDFREAVAPPPPPPPPVKKAEAPPPPPVKKRLILRGVNFDFNKYNIRPQDVPILEEAVRTLKAEGMPVVIAIGHTDDVGTPEYNQRLSVKRADSVRNWLVEHGIPRDKIVAEGRGESDPVASNATADGRAQNRRVELKIKE
jgi:outer membrane protein OmpA-like peptidoglycan-associated protein